MKMTTGNSMIMKIAQLNCAKEKDSKKCSKLLEGLKQWGLSRSDHASYALKANIISMVYKRIDMV